jgi:hypothetical protein
MKNYFYKMNKEKDFIKVYSSKITTTEVSIYNDKGTWKVEHWSGNRDLEDTRNYAELILHACDIATELNQNNKVVISMLLNS